MDNHTTISSSFAHSSPSSPRSGCCFCGVSVSKDKLNDLAQLKCGHVYCKFCLANYLKASILSHTLPLTCIQMDCGKLVPIEELVNIFGVKMMEKFFEFARFNNSYNTNNTSYANTNTSYTNSAPTLNSNGSNNSERTSPQGRRYRCPNAKCARVITRDEAKASNYECPSCAQKIPRNSCSVCGEEATCSKCVAARRSASAKVAPLSAHPNFLLSAGPLVGNTKAYVNPSSTPAPYSQSQFSYFSSNPSSTLFGTDRAPATSSGSSVNLRASTSSLQQPAPVPSTQRRASVSSIPTHVPSPSTTTARLSPSTTMRASMSSDMWPNIWAPLPTQTYMQSWSNYSFDSSFMPTYKSKVPSTSSSFFGDDLFNPTFAFTTPHKPAQLFHSSSDLLAMTSQ